MLINLHVTDHSQQVTQQLAARVDFTILDTSPLLPVTDGAQVAVIADAILVVARAGKATREQALRCVEALAKVGERPVGVVRNMVARGRGGYDREYGYYYSEYRPKGSAPGRHSTSRRHSTSQHVTARHSTSQPTGTPATPSSTRPQQAGWATAHRVVVRR